MRSGLATDTFFSSDRPDSFFKRSQIPFLFVCGLTAIILLSMHATMKWAVRTTIEANSEHAAMIWAAHFNAELYDLDTIVEQGALTIGQLEVVHAAIEYSDIYSFSVFDPQGILIYSTDYGVVKTPTPKHQNLNARGVARSGNSLIEIINRPSATGDPSVFVQAHVPAIGDDGNIIGVIGVFMDKTQRAAVYTKVMTLFAQILPIVCAALYALPSLAYVLKREQAHARTKRVALLSRFDQLTGALNRHTMSSEVKPRFEARKAGEVIGVFFLDIDKFKSINDEYGHEFGDAYLQNIASILINNVREGDLVGRMGGDEFTVAVPKATSADMERIGNRVLEAARQPFEYKGTTIQSSVSIGYHLSPEGETPQSALHAADLALFHAKVSGRSRMVQYFPQLDSALVRRREIEARLREAMEHHEFKSVYQPIVDPKDKSVVGFEALLRLNGNDGNPISPTEFIPIAEETWLIQKIGMYVLRDAIKNAKSWPDHVFVSVNLSPAQFRQGDLVEQVYNILTEFSFPASRLEFEITEGLLMADEHRVSEQLVGLKQLGISIAMDDFGTGYSSLGYLWKYDFDKLKIDRVFLEGFDFDRERYREIIETIVVLGHKMGMAVTVEGVETESHSAMLDQLACDYYQGFYFGKPMTSDQALQTLASQARNGSHTA